MGAHDQIWTWFKLQVTESLTPRKYSPCADCPRPASVPEELLPLGPDEILVASRGGAVTVEGVEVVTPDEFDFQLTDSYLLSLKEDESGLFGNINVGPDAIYKVNPDESLSALTEHPHMLKKLVKDQYKDSLRELKVAAKNQQ